MTRAALGTIGSATQNTQSGPTTITLSTNSSSATYTSAMRLWSRHGGLSSDLLTREQSATWFFKTRKDSVGILQITGFTENPRGVKIRYKLVLNQAKPEAATKRPLELRSKDGSVQMTLWSAPPVGIASSEVNYDVEKGILTIGDNFQINYGRTNSFNVSTNRP